MMNLNLNWKKRFGSALLTLLMVFALAGGIAMPASALSLQNSSVYQVASYDGINVIEAQGQWEWYDGYSSYDTHYGSCGYTSGILTATAKTYFAGLSYEATTTNITFTNKAASPYIFSFVVSAASATGNEAYISCNGTTLTARETPYEFEMAAGATLVISLGAGSSRNNADTTLTLNSFSVEPITYTNVVLNSSLPDGLTDDQITLVGAGTYDAAEQTAVSLNATTKNSNYEFFAWLDSEGKIISGTIKKPSYSLTLIKDETLTAMFIPKDAVVFMRESDSKLYVGLRAALDDNSTGTAKLITMCSGTVPAGNYTIPSGVTLLLPYAPGAEGYQGDATSGNHAYAYADYTAIKDYTTTEEADTLQPVSYPKDGYTYLTMKLADGVHITVNGELALGGTIAARWSGGGFAGQSGGPHSDIAFLGEGSITVQGSSARMTCVGFVYNEENGNGRVIVNDGTIYMPFVITDYQGGSYTSTIFSDQINGLERVIPFNSYALVNVQADLQLVYDGDSTTKLYGYCDLPTGYKAGISNNQHNKCTSLIIGNENTTVTVDGSTYYSGIFVGHAGTTITLSYHNDIQIKGYGKTTMTMDGDVTMGNGYLKISVSNLTSAEVNTVAGPFPIPYNMDICVKKGTFTIPVPAKLMPGAVMTVDPGATVHITSSGSLAVYDGFNDATEVIILSSYPTNAELRNAKLSERAHLYVQGTLQIDGSFGGLVETTDDGSSSDPEAIPRIVVGANATLTLTAKEGGMKAQTLLYGQVAFPEDTKTTRVLKAQVYSGEGWVDLAKDKTYYGDSGETTKDGYVFTRYVPNDTVEGAAAATDTTVKYINETAKTVKGSWVTGYTVHYENTSNAGVASGSIDDAEYAPGAAITLPDLNNIKGYTFNGWNTAEDGSGTAYVQGATMPRKDITLYAQWKANTYTITFEMNGAASGSVADLVVTYGGGMTLPANGFVYPGYTLQGWNTKADGSGITYVPGASADMDVANGAKVELYAVWQANTYTITFDGNGATSGETAGMTVTYGKEQTLPENGFTRTGYTFVGWKLEGGTTYAPGASADMDVANGAEVELYAVWQPNTYFVSFWDGEEEISDKIANGRLSLTYDKDHPVSVIPTKEGYTFLGWSKTDVADEADYKVENGSVTLLNVTAEQTAASNAVPLYAVWQKNQHTVTWKTEDGTVIKTEPVYYGDAINKLDNQDKPGYTTSFDGYVAVMPDEDVTITVKWTAKDVNYTVEIYEMDVSGNYTKVETLSKTGKTDSSVTYDPADKIGFTVADNSELSGTVTVNDEGNGTLVLTVYYSRNQYKLNVVIDGETTTKTYYYGAKIPEITAPNKEGHTFTGWVITKTGTEETVSGLTAMPACDLTYTAKWKINQYTITFDTDGGSAIDPITQDYGTAVTAPADPTKTGYTFDGWDVTIPTTMPAENITIKATWKINQYTITFDTDGGSAIDSITQDYGTAVTAPADPTKTGYTFDGWDVTIPTTMPAGDITIKATWKINQYTITFKNTGDTVVNSITLDYGADIKLPDNPSKTGHLFDGWVITKTGTEETVSGLTTMPACGLTYTAKWKVNQYIITFKNTGDTVVNSITLDYGADIKLPDNPSKTGHLFDGWVITKTGTGETVSGLTTMPAYGLTYTAQWTVKSYTVTWNVDGNQENTVTYKYGAAVNLPEKPTKPGYTFAGWKDAATNTVYEANENVPNMIAGNVEYIAQWTARTDIQYQVHYYLESLKGEYELKEETVTTGTMGSTVSVQVKDFDGFTYNETMSNASGTVDVDEKGEGTLVLKLYYTRNTHTVTWFVDGEQKQSDSYKYGAAIKPYEVGTKTGYTFSGWHTDSNCEIDAEIAKMGNADLIFYGKWQANTYYVTLIYGNGQENGTFDILYNQAYGTKLPTPNRVGYDFLGWYAADNVQVGAETVYQIDGNSTLTAKWTAHQHNVTFDANGGTFADGSTSVVKPQTFGQAYQLPENPVYPGYNFLHWFVKNGENETVISSSTAFQTDADQTVYAKWSTAQVYSITYDLGENGAWASGVEGPKNYTIERGAITLPQPVRPGYAFAGWTGTDLTEATKEVTIPAGSVGDRAYTATWTVVEYPIQYVMNGGELSSDLSNPGSYTIESGDITLHEPVREGYIFLGWSGTDLTEATKAVTIPDGSIGNRSYTAQWKAIEYQVSFNSNLPANTKATLTGTMTDQSFTYDQSQKLKLNEYNLSGYTFLGWNTQADGKGEDYSQQEEVKNLTATNQETITLYAVWKIDSYSLEYDYNNGAMKAGESNPAVYTVETETISLKEPCRPGYTFAGWKLVNEDNTLGAEVVKEIAQGSVGDRKLKATWTANEYEVIFNSNVPENSASQLTGSMANQRFTYDAKPKALTQNAFLCTGYTFVGWNTKPDGSGRAYADKAEVQNLAESGSVTLYAVWKEHSYTLILSDAKFDNGSEVSLTYTQVYTLPMLSKPGYTFAGWKLNDSIPYSGGATVSKLTAENGGTITLTALWEAKDVNYTVEIYEMDVSGNYPEAPTSSSEQTGKTGSTVKYNPDAKTGFTVADNSELSGTVTVNDEGNGTLVLKVYYSRNQYNLNVVIDGNTTTTKVYYGAKIPEITAPNKEGHTFDGWTVTGADAVPTTMPAGDVTVTAKWKVNQYIITFNTDGGSMVDPITQDYDTAITKPADPTRPGYTFAGWDQTIPATMPAKNLTITAQWTVKSYTVTWNGNDGTWGEESTKNTSVNYEGFVIAPATPVKMGHTFDGWKDGADLLWLVETETGKLYREESGSKIYAVMGTAAQTYAAQWTVNKHNVIFVIDGKEVCRKEVAYGEEITACDYTAPNGYTFSGWSEIPSSMPDEDVTITGTTSVNSYTVTWKVDGEVVKTETVVFGAPIPGCADPTKEGYTFTGWKVAGAETIPTTMPAENLTISGTFEANRYTVQFLGNGATSGEMANASCVYGQTFYNYANAYVRTGYTFVGWNTQPDGKGTAYGTNGLRNLTTIPDGTVVLYAQWKANSYTVKFHGNGGSGSMEDQQFTYDEAQSLCDNKFTRTGYTFQGWSKDQAATTATYKNQEAAMNLKESGTVTLYAVWSVNSYTVTWKVDGVVFETKQVEYGAAIPAPDTPTKEGYAFNGWSGYNDGDTMGAADATYEAQWIIQQFTITFVTDGGTIIDPITQNFGTAITAPGNPERVGYRFDGWDKVIPYNMPAENITITAQWTSYLALLVDCKIPSAQEVLNSDPAVSAVAREKLNTARAYFMQMNEEQKAQYAAEIPAVGTDGQEKTTTYKAHRDALFATIKDVATEDQVQNVIGRVPSTNEMFAGEDGILDTEDDIASMVVDSKNQILTVWIEDRTRLALDMLGIDFLLNLFQSNEIYGFDIHQLNPTQPEYIPYANDVTMPYIGRQQFDLMLYMAYATINEVEITGGSKDAANLRPDGNLTMSAFTNWLAGELKDEDGKTVLDEDGNPVLVRNVLKIGILDGESITATVLAKTPEGVEYSVTYVLKFQNRVHDVYWTVGETVMMQSFEFDAEIMDSIVPSKEGYTFAGWTDGEGQLWLVEADTNKLYRMDGESKVYAKMALADQSFTAKFSINQYTITFKDGVGNTVVELKQDYGTEVTAPSAPDRTGYTFDGWDQTIPATMPAEDLTITAKWKVNRYTITFNTDGGTEIAPITQDYDTDISGPADPTKKGYTFDGWYKDESCTVPATIPAAMPAGNVTYYAKWTVNEYTITFVDTDGKVLATIIEDYNTSITAPKAPTKEGYTFAGWDKPIPATMPAENLTIEATWTVNKYTITFVDTDGAELHKITENYGTAVTAPADPTKTGYTFKGWDKTIPVTMPAKDMTIQATWKAKTYKVTLQFADGSTADKMIEVTFDQPYGDALPTPERAGYTFVQWLDAKGNAVSKTTVMQTADDSTVLIAQWKVGASYKITYQNYFGWVEGANVREQFNVEDAFDLPTPVREGYTFQGWVDENGDPIAAVAKGTTKTLTVTATWQINTYTVTWIVDGVETEVNYQYGEKITMQPAPFKTGYTFEGWSGYTDGMTMPAENLEFTATWRINTYTITWVEDGKETKVDYAYGATVSKRDDPTKTGYTFKGWSEDVPATMPANNMTITAVFQINQYTITFVDTDGAELHKITENYGTAVTAPADPTKTGYTFTGWDKTIPATMPAGDVTITAKWKVNQYTITFADGTGGTIAILKQDFGTAIHAPDVQAREGYDFIGWDKEIPETMPALEEPLVITAQWRVVEYQVIFKNEDGTNYASNIFGYGAEIILPAEPAKEGYTFAGWVDASGKTYPAGCTMPAQDLVLTATWNRNKYDLIYLVDGREVERVKIFYGDTISAIKNPSQTGYIFSGWIGIPETMPAKDVFVTGSFTPEQYSVSFDQNYSAAEDLNSITVTFDTAYGTVLPTPVRTGYTFEGWYLDGEKITANTTVKTAGDHSLVAKWAAKQFTVTLDPNGGSLSGAKTLTVTYDGIYGTLPVPAYTGYDFAGWFVGNTQITADTKVAITADQTLVAKWNASGDTRYVVKHYLMNLDGITYTLDGTNELKGATGATITATQNAYTGFVLNTAKSTMSGTVAADGSLVLNLYYDRRSYMVVWNVADQQIRETYLYGAALKTPNTDRADDLHASYTFEKWDVTLPNAVTENATYTAQYSLDFEAVIGNTTYRTLQLALQNAKSGETVSLARNVTVTQDLTVPVGVILLVPCVDNDPGYIYRNNGKWMSNHDGTGTNNHIGLGPDAHLYRTLTVAEGASLTVDGRVLVNSVSGRSGTAGNDQDITGGFGQIDVSGEVIVRKGGALDCFGFVVGEGTVIVKSGGTVGDLFIVRNWRGGTQGLSMYQENVYPMNEHDCNNIRAELRIESGATLEGLVKMYAQGSYYYTRFPQVDNNNGLVRLDSGAYMIRSVKEADGELRTIFKIYGGADFASSMLEIVGLDITSADFRYPIDGDMDYELYDGRYDFVNQHKAMPGATITVGTDAQLYVAKGVDLVLYKEFQDPSSIVSGIETAYPADRGPAKLIILGDGTFTNAGAFAGEIYTENHNIFIGTGPAWDIVTKEANGYQGDPKVYEISHTLNITHREGDQWDRYDDESIVWNGKANYSKVQQAIASIPDDLSYYTDASIADIQPAIDAVIWDLDLSQQDRVDAMAQPILDAIAKLQKKKVTLTLDPVGGTVTPNSFLVDSIGKISEQISGGKLPTPSKQYHSFQGWYDANGNRVRNSSEYKFSADFVLYATWYLNDADYTDVKEARKAIPTDMSMYTDESAAAVQAAVDAIDWTLTANRQEEVDAMAQAIWDAIDSLELKKVTLTLNANGGTVTPGSVQVSYTQTVGNVLPTPVRPGYTFQGWYDASGKQFTASTLVDFTEGVTLTAQWKANHITVTFDPNGGSLAGNGSYSADYGTALTKPADPTRTGYTFTGWYQDAACTKLVTFPATMPTADSTYYAGWKVNTYTITWVVDGKETKVDYAYGATVSKLTDPTKTGYAFIGWDKTVPATMPAENLTITAKFQVKQYTFTFKDTDGKVFATITKDYGAAVTAPADPSKTGYTFAGWNAAVPAIMPAEDKTFIAQWTAKQYTVTLNPDGGVLPGGSTVTVTYDGLYDLPAPSRVGYTFAGWYLNGERVYNGTQVKLTADTTLTARWIEGNAYSIEYMLNGGQWPTDVQIPDFYREEDGDITLPIPVREGYTFLGWTGSNGDQPQIHVTIPAGSVGNQNYTANWKVNVYTITWVVDETETEVTYQYGAAIEMLTDPTKVGHTFLGWDAEPPTIMPAKDLTFTATFQVNSYKLTWIVDGVETEQVLEYGAAINKPADPTKEGYTFTGWGEEVPADMPAKDLAFTAQFQINQYTITFDPAGGTPVDSLTVTYGQPIVLPAAPTRIDYIFLGWEGYEEGMTMPAQNLTFTAQWAIGINKITSEIFNVKNHDSLSKINIGTMVQGLLNGINERDYCTVKDAEGDPVADDALVGTGMTVTLTVDGQEKETVVAIVTGDVTGDGKVTISDMIQVKAHILEIKRLTGAYAVAADVSGDGNITIGDFIQIKAYILGKGSITAR